MAAYFITGTDTEVGKTWVTVAMMKALQDHGASVAGMKPVASGCVKTDQGLRNDDAEKIIEQALESKPESRVADYQTVNPYAFEPAIAPHIAAAKAGVRIDIKAIKKKFDVLVEQHQHVIVEGVGGWNVPLSSELMLADLVKELELGVILVVGMRLGCINHAISTERAIQADGVKLVGWVANQLDQNYECMEETLETLQKRMVAPFLGGLPHMDIFDKSAAAQLISIDMLSN